MPSPVTDEQRGVGALSRGVQREASSETYRASDNKGLVAKPGSSQADPYASHAGPLMKMVQAVNRAEQLAISKERERRLDRLEEKFAARMARYELELRVPNASRLGAGAATKLHDLNISKLRLTKEGFGYGIEWLRQEALRQNKEKPKAYYERKKAEYAKKGVTEVNCLTVLAASLPWYAVGLDGREDGPTFEKIDHAITKAADARGPGERTGAQRVDGGRGTVLLEELRTQLQFETVHVDADHRIIKHPKSHTSDANTRKSGSVPNKPAPVIGADSHTPIDARVKIDRFVKLGKKMSVESRTLWKELKKVPYAVGVADSGLHTYVLSSGRVIEIHWDKGPQDAKLTSIRPIESLFRNFDSLVIAVPPATLKSQ